MDNWFAEIEAKVFTQIEYMLALKTDAPYPDLKCTTVSQNTVVNFPTLYLHELQAVEAGHDLYNSTVNAVISTIEIQVWSNENEKKCKDILSTAIVEMKKLRYNVIMFPDVVTDRNIAWGVARFRRMVGSDDTI